MEAEDKLVGPLSLRQFIYALIAAGSGWVGFLVATKGAPFLLPPFVLMFGVCGFFAFPWGHDQPTEVWALAKIRFMIKPRRRIWDQTGAKELVTVNAPKVVETHHGDGLSQDEVRSRLNALAATIDSRGWAVKNANVNVAMQQSTPPIASSDRLLAPTLLPQPTTLAQDISAADDMLDESASPVGQKFDSLITAAGASHRQQIMAQLNNPALAPLPQAAMPATAPADFWFMNNATSSPAMPGQATFSSDPVVAPGVTPPAGYGATAAQPTAEEEAMVNELRQNNAASSIGQAYGHLRMIKTPEQLAAEARAAVSPAPKVTLQTQAAIMNLANNDDLDVATIARQAKEQVSNTGDGEVVISLR